MEENRLVILQRMLASDPNDAFLRYAIAKEHESAGDTAAAIEMLESLRLENPDYTGLYYHLGKLYEKNDQPDIAISIYDEGIRITKSMGDMHTLSELQNARTNLEMDLM